MIFFEISDIENLIDKECEESILRNYIYYIIFERYWISLLILHILSNDRIDNQRERINFKSIEIFDRTIF